MFKVGDKVLFDRGLRKSGEVLLVGTDSLLVRVKQGKGMTGLLVGQKPLDGKGMRLTLVGLYPVCSQL